MTMITKIFIKQKKHGIGAVERLVNASLRECFWFECGVKNSIIFDGILNSAKCLTPPELMHALGYSLPITFSLTLPEKYWK